MCSHVLLNNYQAHFPSICVCVLSMALQDHHATFPQYNKHTFINETDADYGAANLCITTLKDTVWAVFSHRGAAVPSAR